MLDRQRHLWTLWVVSRAAALATGWVAAHAHRGDVFFDLTYYQSWADGALSGHRVPYRDFSWEYPPGALPAMLAPGMTAAVLGRSVGGSSQAFVFGAVWVAFMLIVDGLVLHHLSQASRPAAVLWLAGLPLLGALSWCRYDLLPAGAAVGAIVAAGSGQAQRSGLLAGLGGALKIWPLLLAPIQKSRSAARRASLTALVVLVGTAAATASWTGSSGYDQVLRYQAKRGLQVESLPALPFLWLRHLHLLSCSTTFRFGAWEVVGPGTEVVALLASLAYPAGLLTLGFVQWRAMGGQPRARTVATGAVAFMVITLITNKVFSPQYLLWLIAALAAGCALDPAAWAPAVRWVLAMSVLTAVAFPWRYGDVLGSSGWWGVLALTLRDVMLARLAVHVARRLRPPEDSHNRDGANCSHE